MPLPAPLLTQRLLAPSILSADFARLGEEVASVLDAGVRLIHVDIMDGHFVPNLTAGPALVRGIAPLCHERGALLDVHLMVERPDDFLQAFVLAGADALSVHVETSPHLHRTLTAIRELGAGAGVAINPASDLSLLGEVLPFVDYVLVMSVDPGFGGQTFIPEMLDKVRRLRRVLPAGAAIEVDGGVGRGNIRDLAGAGANWLVAGSAVFCADDPRAEAAFLEGLLTGAAT